MGRTQRERIEQVAAIMAHSDLQLCDDPMAEFRRVNEDAGWTYETGADGGVPGNWLRWEGVKLSAFELTEAAALAEDWMRDHHREWHDPRRIGRPPVRTVPYARALLEIPADLLAAVDADARRLGIARREWIERALRAALAAE